MASCLQASMPYLIPAVSSFSLGRRMPNSFCFSFGSKDAAKISMPPINPNDPFLTKLASVDTDSRKSLFNRPVNTHTPPYLDLFDSPKLMASPAQVERSVSYNEHRPRRPPPNLSSLLFHGRIVYIGMPLVAAVTELVVAELMYLQWIDPIEPIYLYINSTGTTRDDGETMGRFKQMPCSYGENIFRLQRRGGPCKVGMETEGFAIYDALMQLKNEIHTVCVGAAIGQACLACSSNDPAAPCVFIWIDAR